MSARLHLATLLVTLAACDPASPSTEVPTSPAPAATVESPKADPAEVLSKLEQRLLTAEDLTATCRIESTGAFETAVDATLWLGSQTKHRLDVSGSLGEESGKRGLDHSEPTSLIAVTKADQPGSTDIIQTPQKMRQALVIGLTRMGLLHNIARLFAGELPDHVEGGAAQWVTTAGHRWEAPSPAGHPMIGFDIIVAGAKAGAATIAFDANGFPIQRRQRVEFDGGAMEVVERCSWGSR